MDPCSPSTRPWPTCCLVGCWGSCRRCPTTRSMRPPSVSKQSGWGPPALLPWECEHAEPGRATRPPGGEPDRRRGGHPAGQQPAQLRVDGRPASQLPVRHLPARRVDSGGRASADGRAGRGVSGPGVPARRRHHRPGPHPGPAGRAARPAGIFAIHLELAMVLQRRGCTLLAPAPGWSFTTRDGGYREIRHVGHVAMVSDRGELRHTHSPQPMEAMLGALDEAGEPWPDLVIADHGWAGAAGQAGIEAVGYADCNDPVLFVAEAEGTVAVSVPLDDNVLPHLYAPVTAYLLDALWRCG